MFLVLVLFLGNGVIQFKPLQYGSKKELEVGINHGANIKRDEECNGGLGILVLLSLLFISISLIWDTGQKIGAEAYPPPATAPPQPTATAFPYPAPETQPTPPTYKEFTGPDCLLDVTRGLAIGLPIGWYGIINSTSIEITNYDPDSLQFQHGKALNMPADHIKVEIYVFEIDPSLTIDQFIANQKEQNKQNENTLPIITLGENSSYILGKYLGVTYSITDTAGWNAQAFAVRVNEIKAISLQLFPADSPAYEDAINILSFIDASNNPKYSQDSFIPSCTP